MHADLEQQQRDEVMLDFKAGRIDALIATDIVARGIDIEDISMVVNYDVPRCAEDYVHRIGRTARANAGGIAATLVAGGKEQQSFSRIEKFLKKEITKNPLPEELGPAPEYRPDQHRNFRAKGGKSFRKPKASGDQPRKPRQGTPERRNKGGKPRSGNAPASKS